MSVEFEDLVYQVPSPKRGGEPIRILHGVTASVQAGESLAILGPSGSGKTSLLNLIAGRSMYTHTEGRIRFNGAERTARTKRSIGYVMQDDLFFSRLSVRETLQFTANIRLPTEVSKEERTTRIDNMLEALRLTRAQHTHIGDQMFNKGISGGERKRLNIANELLPDPPLLLGDECTSGLDSSSAFTVVELLKSLSHQGKTVICTIHQPSSQMFYLFDKVLLLSSGRVAYFGTPEAAPGYFSSIGYPFPSSSYNPADAMLELIIDDLPAVGVSDDEEAGLTKNQLAKKRILERWQQRGGAPYTGSTEKTINGLLTSSSEETTSLDALTLNEGHSDLKKGPLRAIQKRWWGVSGQKSKDVLPQKYPVTFWAQVFALARRTMLQKRGNMLEKMQIVQVSAVTLICLTFWFRMKRTEDTIEDRLGALFFFVVFWSFFSVFQALYTFPTERSVLNKDRASGSYRLSAYYLAKTCVEIPADVIYPLGFILIVYWAINLNPSPLSFLLTIVTLLTSVITSLSIGVMISAILVNVKEAQVLASVWILACMLLGGYYINSDNVPQFMRPFRHLSYLKFAYEALVRIEARGQVFACVPPGRPNTRFSNNGKSCPVDEKALLKEAQLDEQLTIFTNILCLLAWSVGTRLVAYFALKYLNRRHKPARQKKKILSTRT